MQAVGGTDWTICVPALALVQKSAAATLARQPAGMAWDSGQPKATAAE